MRSIASLSLAPAVNEWLVNSRHPRILHVFDHACNLINECREVLSVVTPQIGNGPFNVVLENDLSFSNYLHAQSRISIDGNVLHLGDLTIHTMDAKLWSPRPDWDGLYTNRDNILDRLASLPVVTFQPHLPTSALTTLSTALAAADRSSAVVAARQLAGLGIGLTPSGDDFIMGALYAAWSIHPLEIAQTLAQEVANVAAPLTTSLSAVWLRAVGKGEAGILWHEFFDALVSADAVRIQSAMDKTLAVGETSGADALAGFISTFISYAERETKPCHS